MSFFQPREYIDYIAPKLSRGKVWFVYYYAKNPATGRLARVRVKLNRFKALSERRRAAREIMSSYTEKLSLGWNPFVERSAPKAYASVAEAFEAYLSVKSRELEPNSLRSYFSYIKTFRSYLERKGLKSDGYIVGVTREVALDFMRGVEQNPRLSARTFNNYLRFLSTIFNWLTEKGFISDNPFDGIRPKPKRRMKKNRRVLTDAELDTLRSCLEESNREYLAICLLCYCCLIRPKEIALLRCGDIDLEKSVVHIRSEIAKNDNESYRVIPDSMRPYIEALDLSNPKLYLFAQHKGFDFRPGKELLCSRKIAACWNSEVRQACGFGMDLKFYSLKDSGITNMLSEGVPVSFVKQQADHSSLAMTAIYLGRDDARAVKELRGLDIIK